MSSQTPGRRSTRERRSPRNPSPMNTRAPRNSGLSNVETMEAQAGTIDDASLDPTADFGRRENAAAHGMNSTTTPLATTTRPRITMRLNPPAPQPSPSTGNTSRGGERSRKSGRVSEVIPRETLPSSGGDFDEEGLNPGSNRVEESGDDDYNPGKRVGRAKRVKKTPEPVDDFVTGTPMSPSRATKHMSVVDSAIGVARHKKNDMLAMTLKLIYMKSLNNEHLAELLEKILLQGASVAETAEFQTHVKALRKVSRQIVEDGVTDEDFNLPERERAPEKPASPTKAPVQKKTATPAYSGPKSAQTKKASQVTPAPSGRGRPSAAVAARSRGIGRHLESPQPQPQSSTKHISIPRIDAPNQTESAMTTRNSRKRPSATPEPASRVGSAVINGDGERPRKRARRSPSEPQNADIVMEENGLSDSDSALSDLHNSSPEPPAEIVAAENALAGHDRLSGTVHGFKRGGRQLKRQPEPGQKVKANAATKHGVGLPDERMATEKQRLANEFNRTGPQAVYSELREVHEPQPRSRRPGDIEVDGVFTPAAREQIERQSMRSPATSSIDLPPLIPPPPGRSYRDSTPSDGKRVRGAPQRFKVSPTKKKNGFAGGIRFASGRDSPVGVQADGESANLDYCVTCGDSGELVCCDGCPRAFHLVCCDPPYDEEHPPASDSWYCAVCMSKREAIPKPPRSLFANLVHDVKRHNATKFALPRELQGYFEGVHGTDDGAYAFDEAVQAKHRTRASGPAAEAEADSLKIKDSKGNFVLCFKCSLSTANKREMAKCDYCGLHWHLDCLDPPPANPPVRATMDGRPRALWKCPAHAVDDKYIYGDSCSTHKIRRPRNAKVVDTMLNRGLKNNGVIEIENDPSDEEDEEEEPSIYRVTERGIKLDFIERVKRVRQDEFEEAQRREQESRRAREAELQARFDFNIRSFIDQRTALTLLELSQGSAAQNGASVDQQPDILLPDDKVQELIHGLVREAPAEVVAMLADDPPKRPSINGVEAAITNGAHPATGEGNDQPKSAPKAQFGTRDRRALLLLQDLINKKLQAFAEEGTDASANTNANDHDNSNREATNGV